MLPEGIDFSALGGILLLGRRSQIPDSGNTLLLIQFFDLRGLDCRGWQWGGRLGLGGGSVPDFGGDSCLRQSGEFLGRVSVCFVYWVGEAACFDF